MSINDRRKARLKNMKTKTNITSEKRRLESENMTQDIADTTDTLKETIKKLQEINGDEGYPLIQIIPESTLDKNKSINILMKELMDDIDEKYRVSNLIACYDKNIKAVIIYGYCYELVKKGGTK